MYRFSFHLASPFYVRLTSSEKGGRVKVGGKKKTGVSYLEYSIPNDFYGNMNLADHPILPPMKST